MNELVEVKYVIFIAILYAISFFSFGAIFGWNMKDNKEKTISAIKYISMLLVIEIGLLSIYYLIFKFT